MRPTALAALNETKRSQATFTTAVLIAGMTAATQVLLVEGDKAHWSALKSMLELSTFNETGGATDRWLYTHVLLREIRIFPDGNAYARTRRRTHGRRDAPRRSTISDVPQMATAMQTISLQAGTIMENPMHLRSILLLAF
jgi:hypothetical protein